MIKEDLKKILTAFCEKNDFMLNPDEKHVDFLLEGLLKIEAKKGWKLCPCRISDGKFENDLKLLCPCNFKTHDTWSSQGRCWCGLFVKKK